MPLNLINFAVLSKPVNNIYGLHIIVSLKILGHSDKFRLKIDHYRFVMQHKERQEHHEIKKYVRIFKVFVPNSKFKLSTCGLACAIKNLHIVSRTKRGLY